MNDSVGRPLAAAVDATREVNSTRDVDTTHEQRVEMLRQCVADRLFLKVEEIRLDSRLIAELKADSLDFVDLLFQLEALFGVTFQQDEFLDFTFRRISAEGFLLPEAVEQLKAWVPQLRSIADPLHVTLAQLLEMITVETLLILIDNKLCAAGQPERSP